MIDFCGYLIFDTFFCSLHFDVHIVQKSSTKKFSFFKLLESQPWKITQNVEFAHSLAMLRLLGDFQTLWQTWSLRAASFQAHLLFFLRAEVEQAVLLLIQVARNSQNHENHLLYLPDCTLETWRLWWRGNNIGRTNNNFIMNNNFILMTIFLIMIILLNRDSCHNQ